MSMKNLEEALELIELNDDQADFDGPKSDSLLKKAEEALGFSFSATYRTFLSRLGCGDIAGTEFYGVIKEDFENSSVPNAIWLTLKERRLGHIPSSLIIIGSTGDGGYYALDSSMPTTYLEYGVVEWWPGPKLQKTIATDFGEFFLRSIRKAVASLDEFEAEDSKN